MNFKITKMDRRHSGFPEFRYYAIPVYNYSATENRATFANWRVWAWETWGPSCERDWASNDLVWAWDTEAFSMRLYFKSTAELTLFQLKWA